MQVPPPAGTAGSSRVAIAREAGLLRITVRPRRHLFVTVFLAAWLAGWAMGEWTAIRNMLDPRTGGAAIAFLAFWLSAWTLGGLGAGAAFLYSLAGREVITVDTRDLRVRYAALGLGWTRTWDLAGVEALEPASGADRPSAPSARPLAFPKSGGAVRLVHRGKQTLLAGGLDPHDLATVVAELRGRLPARLRSDF